MPENTTAHALLVDPQEDRCQINRYDDRVYITVASPQLSGSRTAGPFTTAELRAATDKVAPLPGDPVDHLEALAAMTRSRDALAKSAKEAQAALDYRTRQRNAAQNRAERLQRELTAERERSQELQGQLEGKAAAYDQLREITRSLELAAQRFRAELAEKRTTEAPRPRTEEDVTDREVEVLMKFTRTWQEGKPLGQQSALALQRARTIILTLSNLPLQLEQERQQEVAAIAGVLGDFAVADENTGDRDDMVLAERLHARGIRQTTEHN